MSKIALTGASGHLGMIIQRMLIQRDLDHQVLLRKPVDYIRGAQVISGDLENEDSRRELVRGCHTVIHCAGKVWPKISKSESVLRINYELTRHLYRDAVQAGVRHFIFISSIHSMHSPHVDTVFDEAAPLVTSPQKAYDFSKAEAERFLNQEKEIKITILNPTAIIGPGDHYLRGLNQLFDRLYRNKLPAVTSGGFSVVDVRDVAHAVVNASTDQVEGKYILAGKYHTMLELTSLYGAVNGLKVTKTVLSPSVMKVLAALSMPFDRMASKPLALNSYAVETLLEGHRGISSIAAKGKLGFTFRPIEDTLRDLHHWFQHQALID